MKDRVAIVTGANTGIGLETARALAERGMTVVMCSRDAQRGQVALEDVRASTGSDALELCALDLGSLASVRAAASEILARHPRVHVLVNNAGLVLSDRRTTSDGFEATFGVNHLGHFLFTRRLLAALEEGGREAGEPSRIVNVSSEAHRMSRGLAWDDLGCERRGYRELAVYADSKLANILFTRELARRLEGRGVVAHAVHPGVVGSSFGKDGDTRGWFAFGVKLVKPLLLTPAKGARTSIHTATSEDAARASGLYWSRSRPVKPSRAARDAEAAKRLWDVSEALVGA